MTKQSVLSDNASCHYHCFCSDLLYLLDSFVDVHNVISFSYNLKPKNKMLVAFIVTPCMLYSVISALKLNRV